MSIFLRLNRTRMLCLQKVRHVSPKPSLAIRPQLYGRFRWHPSILRGKSILSVCQTQGRLLRTLLLALARDAENERVRALTTIGLSSTRVKRGVRKDDYVKQLGRPICASI